MGEMKPVLAVLEVLDRDGSVRHSVSVREWPLRVGRALDNDLVLDDPHTAPHHFSVAPDAEGRVQLSVGDSVNGLQADAQQLARGQQWPVATGPADKPPLIVAGRTHLRLRLAGHALAPEAALAAAPVLAQRWLPLVLLALAVAGVSAFEVWLESDPEPYVRSLGTFAISSLGALLAWAGLWTLLSKIFTRQGHFGWHLRVLLTAVLAWQALETGAALIAFAFSWPWVTDYSFVAEYLILGAMLHFHLQAVEPQHPRRTRAFAVASVVAGVGLSVWFNMQGTDRPGSELYMNHLFPPALRVARPVDAGSFMQGAARLQPRLDEKAQQHDGE